MKRTLLSKKRRHGLSGYPLFSWRTLSSAFGQISNSSHLLDLDCVCCYQPWPYDDSDHLPNIGAEYLAKLHNDSVADLKDIDLSALYQTNGTERIKHWLEETDNVDNVPCLLPPMCRQVQPATESDLSHLRDLGSVRVFPDDSTITVEIYDQTSGQYIKSEIPTLTGALPSNLDLSNAVITPRQHYKDGNLNGTRWYDPSNKTIWVLNVLEPEKANGDHDHVFVRYPATASDSVLVFNKAAAFEFMDKCQRIY